MSSLDVFFTNGTNLTFDPVERYQVDDGVLYVYRDDDQLTVINLRHVLYLDAERSGT